MNILIKNALNSYNYGSMMMCENIINELNKKIDNISFFIEGATSDNINRFKEALNYEKIYSTNLYHEKYFFKKGFLSKVERKLKYEIKQLKIVYSAKKYDYIFVLGGDDYAETYTSHKYALKALKDLNKINKLSKVIMIGQTIGPYTGARKEYASKLFKNINLYTRDEDSAKYLENELKISPKISRDLAFLDLKLQTEYNKNKVKILKKYDLTKDNYVVFVGTGLVTWYTKNEENFYTNFIKIIKDIQKRYPNKKVVWLSHVTTPEPELSDNTMLKTLNKNYDNFVNKNMVVIDSKLLPVEARIILGSAYFTVACRMHAAVSSFQMGKPAICLSYSPKYKGVISNGLNMKDLVVEAKSDTLWEKNILKEVMNKVKYVDINYEKIKQDIEINVAECKKRVSDTLEEIIMEIKKENYESK